jgi:hypothetical protein
MTLLFQLRLCLIQVRPVFSIQKTKSILKEEGKKRLNKEQTMAAQAHKHWRFIFLNKASVRSGSNYSPAELGHGLTASSDSIAPWVLLVRHSSAPRDGNTHGYPMGEGMGMNEDFCMMVFS